MRTLALFSDLPAETHSAAFESWLADHRAAGTLRQASSIAISTGKVVRIHRCLGVLALAMRAAARRFNVWS